MDCDRNVKVVGFTSSLPAHDISEFLQVLSSKIPVIPVTSLDIFINSVQI